VHSDQNLLATTPILDFQAENIQRLIADKGWMSMSVDDAAAAIYEFCRDEILFGYNSDADDMPASKVLDEGFGHCNTKTNLLMALYRAVGIPCRLHGFTIHKELQKGALTRFVYLMAPREIVHTWTEAWLHDRWVTLEGLILDATYLRSVQSRFPKCSHPFLGYAVATPNLQRTTTDWTGGDTFIQREGIAREFGIFSSPDVFYAVHPTNLSGVRGWLYRKFFYKQLNANINRIRIGAKVAGPVQACKHDGNVM
jgi:transglutaminase-like putative cysteine protease